MTASKDLRLVFFQIKMLTLIDTRLGIYPPTALTSQSDMVNIMGHFDGDHGRHDFEHFIAKGDSAENSDEDPGQNFLQLKIVRSRVVSYTPLVSRSR